MKVKLTPIQPKYRNKYVIRVEFMHGDADAETYEDYVCRDRDDFIRVLSAFDDCPQDPGSGGDEDAYDAWCEEMFGEGFVPGDCTCDFQVRAAIRGCECFFFDEDGNEFTAELE
jgi:hypothetical protein